MSAKLDDGLRVFQVVKHQSHKPEDIAIRLRAAIAELNDALKQAYRAKLHVDLDRDSYETETPFYSVSIERREST